MSGLVKRDSACSLGEEKPGIQCRSGNRAPLSGAEGSYSPIMDFGASKSRSISWAPDRAKALVRLCARIAMPAVAACIVAACSSSKSAEKLLNPDPPDKMYLIADTLLNRGRYEDAAQKFEDLDRDHPYSQEARRAIVMAAYSYYKAAKFPEAIATAKRYTTMHPGTKEAPFAHHIIASSYFDDINGPNRDQGNTRKALEEFKVLIARYPESTYAKGAENKIRLCEDSLAAHEMYVGLQYLKNKQWLGAKNRFEVVVREYQTTAHVEEALMRLVEVNMSLGIVQEAQNAAAVLGHNYPNSPWYKDAYSLLQSSGLAPREDSGNWITRQWKSLTTSSTKKT